MDLSNAIQDHRLVEFWYDSHPRVVIPAAYGSHATTGNLVLRVYQIRGTRQTRAVPFWDLFPAEKMIDVRVLDEVFVDDPPAYQRGDKHISLLFAQL
ncbi:MAG: hypothetical protein ABI130_11845 [Leifsonia sp.]